MDAGITRTLIGTPQLVRMAWGLHNPSRGDEQMTWQPITEADLKSQIHNSVNQLSEVDKSTFEQLQTPLRRIACRRGGHRTNEEMFVIAGFGDKVLVYDDVEDEFAIGELEKSHVLKKWDLLGDLASALSALNRAAARAGVLPEG